MFNRWRSEECNCRDAKLSISALTHPEPGKHGQIIIQSAGILLRSRHWIQSQREPVSEFLHFEIIFSCVARASRRARRCRLLSFPVYFADCWNPLENLIPHTNGNASGLELRTTKTQKAVRWNCLAVGNESDAVSRHSNYHTPLFPSLTACFFRPIGPWKNRMTLAHFYFHFYMLFFKLFQ